MAEPKTREWPLIVFTVGLQLSAGIAILASLQQWHPETATSVRPLAVSVFPVVLVAISGSLFHLGRPLAAWRALTNIRESSLSLEVAFAGLFAALSFVEGTFWLLTDGCPTLLGIGTAMAGALAVISSASIYLLPAQPLWNSRWVPISFIGSTLLLGGVAANILGGFSLLRLTIMAGAALLLVSTAGMVRDIRGISLHRYASPEAVPIMQVKHWLSACGVVVLGGIVPTLQIAVANTALNRTVGATASFVLTLVGVALGRGLMLSRGIALSRF
jgi:anaerobic dimethyl sulfoxide reductase subunit C (anchor subunit)